MSEKICIVRLSAIGDTCHALAVIRSLTDARADAEVTWVIGKTEASLMEGVENVRLISFDKSAGISEYFRLRKLLKDEQFDILLMIHASARANMVCQMIRAKRRIGYDRKRARDFQWLFSNESVKTQPQQHVLDAMFSFIEHIHVARHQLRWDIPLSEADREFALQHVDATRPTLIISPCSSDRSRNFRNWQVKNYAEIADYVNERYAARVILTGGHSALEREFGIQISAACGTKPQNLIAKTTLKQLLALIEAATVMLCPDSGPAHMATCVATPVVGLYAGSNPLRTGPYLSQDLVVNAYPAAIQREFDEDVGDVSWGQRVRDPDVMSMIDPAIVRQKLDRVLGAG